MVKTSILPSFYNNTFYQAFNIKNTKFVQVLVAVHKIFHFSSKKSNKTKSVPVNQAKSKSKNVWLSR